MTPDLRLLSGFARGVLLSLHVRDTCLHSDSCLLSGFANQQQHFTHWTSVGATNVLEIWAKHTQNHATCTFYRAWPGQCAPLSHACHAVQILPALVLTAKHCPQRVF